MAKKRLDEATKKRLRAGRMLLAGKRPAEVALAVGVARQTVYTWKTLLEEGGIDALRAVPGRGRPAQLDQAQLASVRAALLQGDWGWLQSFKGRTWMKLLCLGGWPATATPSYT